MGPFNKKEIKMKYLCLILLCLTACAHVPTPAPAPAPTAAELEQAYKKGVEDSKPKECVGIHVASKKALNADQRSKIEAAYLAQGVAACALSDCTPCVPFKLDAADAASDPTPSKKHKGSKKIKDPKDFK